MPTLAGINGASLVPDFQPAIASYERGQERERLLKAEADKKAAVEREIGALTDPNAPKNARKAALLRLNSIDAKVGGAALRVIESGDEAAREQLKATSERAAREAVLVGKQPTFAAKRQAINSLAQDAAARGEDVTRFVDLMNKDEAQLDLAIQKAQVMGADLKSILGGGEGGDFSKAPGVVTRDESGTAFLEIPVFNKATGEITMSKNPISSGLVTKLGETGTEESLRKAAQAGQEELAKRLSQLETASDIKTQEKRGTSQEARTQDVIDKGVVAADSMAVLNRSLELMDSVKTGGVARASAAAKRAFGVEGADEAELFANLGKTVLSQLRSTFGAAFTENEGKRLAAIEANFGKSTAANRRLLEQTKRIAERAANRAIRAAEKSGDKDTADEIREAMAFTLAPEEETPQRRRYNPATGKLE